MVWEVSGAPAQREGAQQRQQQTGRAYEVHLCADVVVVVYPPVIVVTRQGSRAARLTWQLGSSSASAQSEMTKHASKHEAAWDALGRQR